MKGYIYCYIASAFLVASIYMNFIKSDEYEKTLTTDTEKNMYKKVKSERVRIYLIATGIALAVTGLLFYFMQKNNPVIDTCFYTAIFFIVQYFVYSLIPKQNWMLDTVTDGQDAKDWLKKYKMMKMNWHLGLVFGIVAFGFYSFFILDKNADKNILSKYISSVADSLTSELFLNSTPIA